jgi:hypothetical protein
VNGPWHLLGGDTLTLQGISDLRFCVHATRAVTIDDPVVDVSQALADGSVTMDEWQQQLWLAIMPYRAWPCFKAHAVLVAALALARLRGDITDEQYADIYEDAKGRLLTA